MFRCGLSSGETVGEENMEHHTCKLDLYMVLVRRVFICSGLLTWKELPRVFHSFKEEDLRGTVSVGLRFRI